jgi:hypothetical protein
VRFEVLFRAWRWRQCVPSDTLLPTYKSTQLHDPEGHNRQKSYSPDVPSSRERGPTHTVVIAPYQPIIFVQYRLWGPPSPYPAGTGVPSSGLKWSGHEANQWPPSSVEVKSLWSYTFTPPHVCMASCFVKHRVTYPWWNEKWERKIMLTKKIKVISFVGLHFLLFTDEQTSGFRELWYHEEDTVPRPSF